MNCNFSFSLWWTVTRHTTMNIHSLIALCSPVYKICNHFITYYNFFPLYQRNRDMRNRLFFSLQRLFGYLLQPFTTHLSWIRQQSPPYKYPLIISVVYPPLILAQDDRDNSGRPLHQVPLEACLDSRAAFNFYYPGRWIGCSPPLFGGAVCVYEGLRL